MIIILNFLVLLASHNTYSQVLVGGSCRIAVTESVGTCVLNTDCPIAKKEAAVGILPTICGYTADYSPIICCRGEVKSEVQDVVEDDGKEIEDKATTKQAPAITRSSNGKKNYNLAEQKCNEYNSHLTKKVQILHLSASAVPTSINYTTCDNNAQGLIAGGTPVMFGEFPFMAALGTINEDKEFQWVCGGSLISDRYVMTASHCFKSKPYHADIARLGVLNLLKFDDGVLPEDYAIDEVFKYPKYRTYQKYDDIALLRLKTVVRFSKNVRPACLWTQEKSPDAAIAAGWGKTGEYDEQSQVLLKVSLDVFPNSRCETIFKPVREIPQGITNTMICGGYLKGGKDTCMGDSGGPLFIAKEGNNCVFHVFGITSFGRSCAQGTTPAIYTKVAKYIQWIEETVWAEEN